MKNVRATLAAKLAFGHDTAVEFVLHANAHITKEDGTDFNDFVSAPCKQEALAEEMLWSCKHSLSANLSDQLEELCIVVGFRILSLWQQLIV